MRDSSESDLDVFDDLVRKPKSHASEGRAPFASEPRSGVVEQSAKTRARADDELSPNSELSAPSTDPLEGILVARSRAVPPAASTPSKRSPPPAEGVSRAPHPTAAARPRTSSSPDEVVELAAEPVAEFEAAVRPPPPSQRRRAASPKQNRAPSRPPPPSSMGFGAGRSTPLPVEPKVLSARSSATSSRGTLGKGVWIAAAVAVVLAVAVAVSFSVDSSRGTLIVSASGPHGRALASVATFVDGVKRCDRSPCRIEGLSDGVHIVEARAPGHVSIAGKAVKVVGGDEVPFDLELLQDDASAPAQERKAKPRATADEPPVEASPGESDAAKPGATSVNELARAEPAKRAASGPSAVGTSGAPGKVADKQGRAAGEPSSAASSGTRGTLNFNSVPASNVVLDGRPLGRTPQMGVSVAPGSHSVVFVHPTHGRKSHQVAIEAGQTRTAVVRFP